MFFLTAGRTGTGMVCVHGQNPGQKLGGCFGTKMCGKLIKWTRSQKIPEATFLKPETAEKENRIETAARHAVSEKKRRRNGEKPRHGRKDARLCYQCIMMSAAVWSDLYTLISLCDMRCVACMRYVYTYWVLRLFLVFSCFPHLLFMHNQNTKRKRRTVCFSCFSWVVVCCYWSGSSALCVFSFFWVFLLKIWENNKKNEELLEAS